MGKRPLDRSLATDNNEVMATSCVFAHDQVCCCAQATANPVTAYSIANFATDRETDAGICRITFRIIATTNLQDQARRHPFFPGGGNP